MNASNHLIAPGVVHHLGDDGRTAGGQLIKGGDIQIGVVTHGQRARNRGGGHHEQVRLLHVLSQLAAQGQPLCHAKAVLLVDDGQRQLAE